MSMPNSHVAFHCLAFSFGPRQSCCSRYGLIKQEYIVPLLEDTSLVYPLPPCKLCSTAGLLRAPGIGLPLEMVYGHAMHSSVLILTA